MQPKLFQSCCRLCLNDNSKQLTEISSVEKLADALEKLYDLKISKSDRCSNQICGDCQQEVTEANKWLLLKDELKQQITANQVRFEAEVLEQLGPEPVPEPPRVASPSPRSARLSRRSGRLTQTPTDEIPTVQPIKEEPIVTRSSRRSGAKQEWEPPASDAEHSETPTSSSGSNGEGSNDDDEASTTESGTTTSSEVDLKCPRCDATFTELVALEKHACRFICSICSTVMKHKKSLKQHLINKHNVRPDQWESYWNPPQVEPAAGHEQSLLVEGRRPRKRYRYESDSPTDIEDEVGGDGRGVPAPEVAMTEPGDNIYCSLCNDSFNGEHDCPFVCNICGNTFASPNNVKRHKINVHKLEPDHPSLLLNFRRRSTSRPPSRPPSRAPSRAASECPSDDDMPLAAVAQASRSRCDSVASDWNSSTSGQKLYRFFCTDCDYTNVRRYRVTAHMKSEHAIPADQIDPEAIRKELLGMRSKTPEPPRTRYSSGTRTPARAERARTPFDDVMALGGPAPPLDPAPLDAMEAMMQDVPESASFPVLTTSPGFRSRSRSTYMDDMDRKRKRSMSACSMREPRTNRAVSERNVLVAKRRLTNAELLARVQSKFRPTMAGIQANRLQLTSQLSCVPVGTPMEQPLKPRVSAYHPEEPCTNKRLFRRRAPVGNERTQLSRLRRIFQGLSDRVPIASSVNPIDVDALVLIPSEMLPPQLDPEPPIIVDQEPPVVEQPPEQQEERPAQQPEPDSTTPVADDVPMDEEIRVVIEIAEDDNQSPEPPAAAEVVQTVETTEERSEEIVSQVETEGPQEEQPGEIEEVVEEQVEEVEETIRVEVEEEILPD